MTKRQKLRDRIKPLSLIISKKKVKYLNLIKEKNELKIRPEKKRAKDMVKKSLVLIKYQNSMSFLTNGTFLVINYRQVVKVT